VEWNITYNKPLSFFAFKLINTVNEVDPGIRARD